MSERILITGADGFVGRHVIEALLERPGEANRIFATCRAGGRAFPASVETVALDVTEPRQVQRVVAETKPTTILHLAAIAATQDAQKDRGRTWSVNLTGTMSLAEATLTSVPDARFIYIGSAEVYGSTFQVQSGPLDEDATLRPTTSYAASKAAADLLVGQMVHTGLNAVRFRPFNHTGPGQTTRFVVPAFASQIARIEAGLQQPVIKVGNLEPARDFLDVRDVVRAYVQAIFAGELRPGSIFNIASGIPRKIASVLRGLCDLSRVEIAVEQDAGVLRRNEVMSATGNAEVGRSALDWQPLIPWEQTLRDVLEEHRNALRV